MKFFQDLAKQYGPLAVLLISTVSLPLYSGMQAYRPTEVQAAEPKQSTSLNELLPLLQLVAQRQPAPQPEPPVPASGNPMLDAINRMERSNQKLASQMAERDEKMSEQLTQFINASYRAGSEVDRSGNTKEQLEDIYQDANVPQLPDALVKGLASNPGARATIHPDHGQPVIAVTEWGVTNYGGGKQLNLLRHKGRVYGQTIIHGDQTVRQQSQQQAAPEKKPASNLNLGNN